jgi:hypothetical protein
MPTPVEVKEKYEDELLTIDGVVGVVATADRLIVMVETGEVCGRIPSSLEGVPVECRVVGRIRI